MADTNLALIYAATPTSIPVGKVFYCIDPALGAAGDQGIIYEDLVKPITDLLLSRAKDTGKAAAYTKTFNANSKLVNVDIKKTAGTPVVKIGTTAGASDVLSASLITGITLNAIALAFAASTTLYITVTGVTVSINWEYYENIF